jgi:hypothetical protein
VFNFLKLRKTGQNPEELFLTWDYETFVRFLDEGEDIDRAYSLRLIYVGVVSLLKIVSEEGLVNSSSLNNVNGKAVVEILLNKSPLSAMRAALSSNLRSEEKSKVQFGSVHANRFLVAFFNELLDERNNAVNAEGLYRGLFVKMFSEPSNWLQF